jgi:hypothetical protein
LIFLEDMVMLVGGRELTKVGGEHAMPARLVEVKGKQVKIELTVELSRSMLASEEAIQVVLNEAGCIASREALRYFDTDGSPLKLGAELWRTKGRQPKCYQTPYGEAELSRHVYQRSGGGTTYCPLERDAHLVITSTPRFARQRYGMCNGTWRRTMPGR